MLGTPNTINSDKIEFSFVWNIIISNFWVIQPDVTSQKIITMLELSAFESYHCL